MKRLMILLVTLCFLIGCASTGTFKMRLMDRDDFMSRAYEFDQKWAGQERTPAYQYCYGQFFGELLTECRDLVEEEGPNVEYWGCCDVALDNFEDCLEEQNVSN